VTDIFGVIVRPSTFDASKKYPVIEQIYAGPHSAFVPKGFSTHLGMQEMAELGFIKPESGPSLPETLPSRIQGRP
jgi:dipeptidyl aminopeptidase/acylaminoacyl peptidase